MKEARTFGQVNKNERFGVVFPVPARADLPHGREVVPDCLAWALAERELWHYDGEKWTCVGRLLPVTTPTPPPQKE